MREKIKDSEKYQPSGTRDFHLRRAVSRLVEAFNILADVDGDDAKLGQVGCRTPLRDIANAIYNLIEQFESGDIQPTVYDEDGSRMSEDNVNNCLKTGIMSREEWFGLKDYDDSDLDLKPRVDLFTPTSASSEFSKTLARGAGILQDERIMASCDAKGLRRAK